MLEFEDLKEAKLGEDFAAHDLQRCCRAIYGGVAWPGKNPGWEYDDEDDEWNHTA